MIHFHKTPERIFTNHLGFTGVVVNAENDTVLMIGVYHDMLTGDFKTVEIETPFEKMYRLLSEEKTDDDADVFLKPITTYLKDPDEEQKEFIAEMGVTYLEQIFCLRLIIEVDEEGNLCMDDEPRYALEGYMPSYMFQFLEFQLPDEEKELTAYYNELLAMRYYVYRHFMNQKMKKRLALHVAGLEDPLLFQMSKRTFEEMEVKWVPPSPEPPSPRL